MQGVAACFVAEPCGIIGVVAGGTAFLLGANTAVEGFTGTNFAEHGVSSGLQTVGVDKDNATTAAKVVVMSVDLFAGGKSIISHTGDTLINISLRQNLVGTAFTTAKSGAELYVLKNDADQTADYLNGH